MARRSRAACASEHRDCGAPECGPCFSGTCLAANAQDSCSPDDYAVADVEVAPLPGAASAVADSLATHAPSGGSPTSAALAGALRHMQARATASAGRPQGVIFVTDGDPTECDTDVGHIAALAQQAAQSSPRVLTFVVALGAVSFADSLAAAGGTAPAFPVDTGGNVASDLESAFDAIASAASACRFEEPAGGGALDVAVDGVALPQVADAASCLGDGWFVDSSAGADVVTLCAATCSALDLAAQVTVSPHCG